MVTAALLVLACSAAAPDPPDVGTLKRSGCLACHSIDGSAAVGPSFAGAWGTAREVVVAGGKRAVTFDAEYLRRSLSAPHDDVVVGFVAGLMPRYDFDDERVAKIETELRALATMSEEAPAATSLWVWLGAALFVFGHLALSAGPVRGPLVDTLGAKPFSGVYSVVTGAGFGLMVWGWTVAPYVQLWPPALWTRWVPHAVVPLAFMLVVLGYTTKNPTSAGQEGALEREEPARGILRITRHPANVGMAMWGAAHLVPNGDVAGLAMFGAVALLGVVGSWHIDRRRRAADGEAWARFEAVTSVMPFVAIVRGRNRLVLKELLTWRLALALALYVFFLMGHVHLIGASPF